MKLRKRSDSDTDENRKSGYAYAAGITLFASVAVFCGLGWFLDEWLYTALAVNRRNRSGIYWRAL